MKHGECRFFENIRARSCVFLFCFFVFVFALPAYADTIANQTTLIASGSLPAANNLDITNISANFSYLKLDIARASSNTASRRVYLRWSFDNGSTFKTTGYQSVRQGDSAFESDTALRGVTQTAAEVSTTTVIIYGYSGSSSWVAAHAVQISSAGQFQTSYSIYDSSAGPLNAIRVIWDSTGNFDAGTYALYGVGATTTSLTTPSSSTSTTTSNYAPTQQEFLFLVAVVLFIGSIPFWERSLGGIMKNDL